MRRQHSIPTAFRLLPVCLALVGGCGPDRPLTIPVDGTVTVDGRPVEGASVMFMPQFPGRPALGVTDASGQFRLTTFASGDGAQPGQHTVTVTLQKTTGFVADKDGLSGGMAPEGVRIEWVVPQRYSKPETSELSVEVKQGMSSVKLDLTSS
jgi:hypothetical protein